MLNFYRRFIDDNLIERFYQPVVNWAFTLFGLTQFRSAQICFCFSFSVFAVGLTANPDFTLFMVVLGCVFLVVGATVGVVMLSEQEKQQPQGFRNPERLHVKMRAFMAVFTLLCILWDSLDTASFVEWQYRYVGWLLFISTFYLKACDYPTSYLRERAETKGKI